MAGFVFVRIFDGTIISNFDRTAVQVDSSLIKIPAPENQRFMRRNRASIT
jgi:hypothetical protein